MTSRAFFVLFIFSLPLLSYSQINESFLKKYSPTLLEQRSRLLSGKPDTFVITVSGHSAFKEFIAKAPRIFTIYEYPLVNTFLVETNWAEINEKVITRPDVLFIDIQRTAKEEVAVSNLDISANKINKLHSIYPQYNGTGLNVSVKENRPDTADIDFKGRYSTTSLTSATLSSHATIMSTIIAGAGNSYYEGKGVATAAGINSVSFAVLLPEPDNFYQQYNVSVQNHSYGTGIENYYGADAAAYDASVAARPHLFHVFSAGNSGAMTSTSGPYANVQGYANITGSFKMAKNIITVGHTDSFGVALAPSSKGPAYDGRIKPELVAFGEDGSSGAAAIVSGIALSLQQAYKELNGSLPATALLKAILLNTADDAGAKGIDFTTGYGSVNAIKTIRSVVNAQYFSGSVSNGGSNTVVLNVPPNLKQLKVILAWTDPASTTNATKALTNDLDLELSLPAASQTWLPWVLNHFPHIDSVQKLPTRKRDSLNTTEQITLDNPAAGTYTITTRGFSIPVAPQSYFISYQFDTADKFEWQYPAKTDNITGGNSNAIRWESSYPNSTGQLEYSINNGSSWQLVSNNIDLAKGYYKWNAPDTFVNALLRMNFAAQNFRSDTFTISKRMNTFVGFNCPDSFLFYWNKVKGVNSYQVYRLGAKYMESILVTTDTIAVLGKQTNPALYYAVAPLVNTKTGLRSYAFDYTTQGVGCYIKSFTVSLAGNTGRLELELGITYRLKNIRWEKLSGNGFTSLQTINAITGVNYTYNDNAPSYGINTYRVRIELLSGQVIYSNTESLFYFGNRSYIIYPNPAEQYQPVTILLKEPDPVRIQVFNAAGVKIYEKTATDIMTTIPAGRLSKGLHFLRISAAGKATETLKLVVY
jgi:hypothetical protein